MRLSAAFLSLIFLFGSLDFIPARKPVTCCGRVICTCTHAKHVACPFKSKMAKKHCHAKETVHENAAQTGGPRLSSAPCHKSTPKTFMHSFYKDFFVPEPAAVATPAGLERILRVKTLFSGLVRKNPLERPPSISLLSI